MATATLESKEIDEQLDSLFEDASYIIVNQQQGSASLIQRKLKIGYNRAGRIIDQMEATGLIGAHRGSKAREVLGKKATVVNNKPDFEFLVEGHTDSQSINTDCMKDNWDLSVLRATTVVRILQDDFGVAPERMTAGGRSQYIPKASNETAETRAKNRRTRIVVLPKLDQFYSMIEEGLNDPAIN